VETNVIQFPDASIVATAGLLLLYVIAPLLLLVGRGAVITNDASNNVLDDATVKVDSMGVPRKTVSGLLDMDELVYCAVAACVALKLTSPTETSVIQLPHTSIVAMAGLLLLYVIAPLLLLVGRVIIAKDASPNALDESTVNVDAEKFDEISLP
jgi:cytochrome c oxidase assembly factor CtaG